MSEYLYTDPEKPKTDHPDAAIRLAAVVHRFRVPTPTKRISFVNAFHTVGKHDKTRRHMNTADDARKRLTEATSAERLSAERVTDDARRYQPLIHGVLLSCKVQPEQARLDEKLVFEWKSGIEDKGKPFKSEAIMYDLVMAVATEGLGRAVRATEQSVAGEFAAASRDYAAAAGIFHFLAEDQLPKWISKGSNVDDETLPSECHAPMAKALKMLFQANGQQMAIATLLVKAGTPNYSLLAKLCCGVGEKLDDFVALLRREAFTQMNRLDKDFLTLVTFQISVQQSLCLYFQGRSYWEQDEHGLAIAFLSEATVALRTRETIASRGVPDVTRTPQLRALQQDLHDLRAHMKLLLQVWEQDNNQVYFERVPQHVPAGKKLQEGLQMNKKEDFKLEEVEPLLLHLPEGALERSDSDLAKELQERLNAGEE